MCLTTASSLGHRDFEIAIQQDFDKNVGTVEMIPQEMRRVLQNLLNNAFETVHEKINYF